MQAELLAAESTRWSTLVTGMPHDFYHLPSYVAFAAQHQEPGTPMAFIAEDAAHRLLIPLIVRPVPPELLARGDGRLFDATGPRGYPGPIVTPGEGAEAADFLDRALGAFGAILQANDIVAAYIRLHPLMTPPRGALERVGALVDHGTSTVIDLTLPLDELWHQTDHGHRSRINKARRLGYVGRHDESWARFDDFVNLYGDSMDRVGAHPFWHLSRAYFEALRKSLPDLLHLLVVERGEELAAAGLFTEVDGLVEYHLAGVADPFVRDSPSKLLIDTARRWAKDRGDRQLHLAGSLRADDSLALFKRGFSPLSLNVSSWRVIADDERYRRLAARWAVRHGTATDGPDGFFPAYRKDGPPSG